MNSINRLPARANSYESEQDALALDRDASRMKLLNGMWKFHFAAEEMQDYGYPIYTNIS